MADEVFALSPISARAAQPSEADYEAIREAFMETSRGRWFLGEYAKRNRNADTGMVLDAVARIEEVLATQKKVARDEALDKALAAIRIALGKARAAADATLDELALQQNLAPVRKGARVIREIAWRLREIGADGRICDLIDSQVAAIEGAAARMAAIDPASGLGEAFDLVARQIAAFNGSDAAIPGAFSEQARPPEAAEETVREIAAPPPPEPVSEAPIPAVQALDAPAWEVSEAPIEEAAIEALAATADEPFVARAGLEAEITTADPAPAIAEAAVTAESAPEPIEVFDADDEAMLDRIALEMAAPDSDDAYDPTFGTMPPGGNSDAEAYMIDVSLATAPAEAPAPARSAEAPPPVAQAQTAAAPPAPAVMQPLPAPAAMQPAPVPPAVRPEPASEPELSLGSSLLANGIVPRPQIAKPDPFAPIRRMSQTERIAFFS